MCTPVQVLLLWSFDVAVTVVTMSPARWKTRSPLPPLQTTRPGPRQLPLVVPPPPPPRPRPPRQQLLLQHPRRLLLLLHLQVREALLLCWGSALFHYTCEGWPSTENMAWEGGEGDRFGMRNHLVGGHWVVCGTSTLDMFHPAHSCCLGHATDIASDSPRFRGLAAHMLPPCCARQLPRAQGGGASSAVPHHDWRDHRAVAEERGGRIQGGRCPGPGTLCSGSLRFGQEYHSHRVNFSWRGLRSPWASFPKRTHHFA
jgi:hypothetical protein